MSSPVRSLRSPRFETVQFLRLHPEMLEEVEAILGTRASEPGGAEGASPPLHLLSFSDNWLAPPPNPQGRLLPPKAEIPPFAEPQTAGEIAKFTRDSLDESDSHTLPKGWMWSLPKLELNEAGEVVRFGDGTGPNQEQARALAFLGLPKKANRLASCGQLGRRIECPQGDAFFERFRCGLRYCEFCGPANFQALFAKHIRLEALAKPCPGHVVAILDFTLRNTGAIPDPETIRLMNQKIRRVMRRLCGKRKDWGYLWCDEFGFDNENLHAHGVYYGPYLAQKKLSDAWLAETGDSKIVWIQTAESFRRGLIHALKYTQKMPSEDPKRLAQLEAASHGVRRVHALGVFYHSQLSEEEDSGARSASCDCPLCGRPLSVVGAYCSVSDLESTGLRELRLVRAELRRRAALMLGSPP